MPPPRRPAGLLGAAGVATTHFLSVARIGEASNPGPSRPPLMSIKHDAHWINGGSDDEHNSDWSVEDMYEMRQGDQEEQQRTTACEWHAMNDTLSDSDGGSAQRRQRNALDDPEGEAVPESSCDSDASQPGSNSYLLGQAGGDTTSLGESAHFIRAVKFEGARRGFHFK